MKGSKAVRDSVIVTLGGQAERVLGTFTAVALRWGLDPASLGVYTGLRLYLDNTNRSSLGVSLGAVQEIPVLRAQGRFAEADRVTSVAHTTNSLTCLIYAAGLLALALWTARSGTNDPLVARWVWGLACVAGLAILKRYESFLIVVLRAHGEFALTTRLDLFEACLSAVAVGVGLWIAGFWGLMAAVAVILMAKILFLRWSHPLRLRWRWEFPTVARLMKVGLPIMANTAAFGAVIGIDRVLILSALPDGERAAGLYTIALMGTGWSLDVAGRVGLVLSTHFLTTLGESGDRVEVARQAMRSTEALAPVMALGGAIAYVFAPSFLAAIMPRYAEGVVAIRPLLPGMVVLGLSWPARQFLIAIGRPLRLFMITILALALLAECGIVGAVRGGLVGVALAMSIGYASLVLLVSGSAFAEWVGWRSWFGHVGRVSTVLLAFAAVAVASANLDPGGRWWVVAPARGASLAVGALPVLAYCGWRMNLAPIRMRRVSGTPATVPS